MRYALYNPLSTKSLSKEQLEIYNTSMNIKEIGGSKYGR